MEQVALPAEGARTADIPPLQTFDVTAADGTRILVRRMSAHPARRYVVSHGNGLSVAGYRPFWQGLLPDAEVVMFDFRNHGMNPPAVPSQLNNWANFVSDFANVLAAIDAHLGARPTYGVFHSMSALTCLLHASSHGYPWQGLVLFEPPAVPPPDRPEYEEHIATQRVLAARTRTRRASFEAPEQLVRSLARIPMFQRMQHETLERLVLSTLREGTDGAYQLVCPPDFEADTFSLWEMEPHWDGFARIACPVKIVASAPQDSDTPILSHIARRLADEFGFAHAELPASGHMVQLDRPQDCVDIVRDFFAKGSG